MATLASRMAVALAICAGAVPVAASAPARTIQAIVYVDLIPTHQAAGSSLLASYVQRARRDPEVNSIALIEQSRIPNHYIVAESFVGEENYARFRRQAYVRDFRSALYPHLGSPWDERLGTEIVP